MSGVFGIFYRDGKPALKDELGPISDSLRHRGPDGQGYWSSGPISLGHRMFHTTPEALYENLPYTDTGSGLNITCDVRLDNRDKLKNQLNIDTCSMNVITDSYLLLAAYQKWGIECPNYLLGDFAFAIWDQKNQQLFCARDHMGIKPFAYYSSETQFVFASEAHAIIKAPHVPCILNDARIADFLIDLEINMEGIDKTSTFYEKVYRLPPAHRMVVTTKDVSVNCYWQLDQSDEIRFQSDEEYIDAFSEIYIDAISKRLRGNGDVAAMLSGGIDSSSIVGIARGIYNAETGKPFPVFSAISGDSVDCTETHFINAVISQGGLKASSISIDSFSGYNQKITNVIHSLIEPFDFMPLIIATYVLARNSGQRVILDGIDGDLVASHTLSYPAYLMRDGQWSKAINEINCLRGNYFYRDNFSFINIFQKYLRTLLIPSYVRKLKRKYCKSPFFSLNKTIQKTIISKKFAERIKLLDRVDYYQHQGFHSYGLYPTLRAQQISSIEHPHIYAAIERYDRVAALCGIEPRHPLLDKRLIQFMVDIPWDQKVRNGFNKHLLRCSSQNILPKEVCWRRGKEHLGWRCTKNWLNLNHKEIFEVITSKHKSLERFTDYKKLQSAMKTSSLEKAKNQEIEFLLTAYLLLEFLTKV